MNLQDLRYVVALAETGHFARAAEACHVSQSTLSTQLKKLEDYLGITLFDRSLRKVAATPSAQEIVAGARRILEEVERIRALAKLAADPMARTITLGAIPTAGPYVLPRVLEALHRRYPRLRLLLREAMTAALLRDLGEGRIDAALLALPVPEEGLHAEPLFSEPFYAALPTGHPLARQKTLAAEDLPETSSSCWRTATACGRRRWRCAGTRPGPSPRRSAPPAWRRCARWWPWASATR